MSTPNIFWTKEGPSADFEQAAPEARMAAMVEFLEAISNIKSDYSQSDSDSESDSAFSDALLDAMLDIKSDCSSSDSESDSTSSDDSIDSLYLRSSESSSSSLVSSPRRSRERTPVSSPRRSPSVRYPIPVFYPTPVSPYKSEANPIRPEDVVPFVFRKTTHRPVRTRLFRIAIGENVWA